MKLLWNTFNKLDTKTGNKNKGFIASFVLINIVFGSIIWALVGRFLVPGIEGLFNLYTSFNLW